MSEVIERDVSALTGSEAASSLWPILSRGLAKDPERRYQSMRELGNVLAAWLSEGGVTEDLCGDALGRTWQLGALPPT